MNNELVLVKSKVLSSRKKKIYWRMSDAYHGPYKVARKFGNATFEVCHPKTDKTIGKYHVTMLKKYKTERASDVEDKEERASKSSQSP